MIILILLILIAFIPIIAYVTIRFFEYKSFKSNGYANLTSLSFRKMINDKGAYGEFLTYSILRRLYPKSKIFINLYIPINGKTTEIDLLLIHKTGIYVFESKNYSGWIFGKEKDNNWTVQLSKNKKYKFFNPIKQNEFHIKALKQMLDLDEKYFSNIIVFSDRCELKKIKAVTPIMKRKSLKKELSKNMRNKDIILNETEIIEIENFLKNYCNVSDNIKNIHINNLKKYKC